LSLPPSGSLWRYPGAFAAKTPWATLVASCNDGRIEEEWELIDVPGLLGQIGAPPETAAG